MAVKQKTLATTICTRTHFNRATFCNINVTLYVYMFYLKQEKTRKMKNAIKTERKKEIEKRLSNKKTAATF